MASDDLPARLRRISHPNTTEGRVAQEAATEIERLRELVAELSDSE